MDQATLVNVDLDAGAILISRFDDFMPVKVAFWIRREEEGPWELCIASEQINDGTIDRAYGEILRISRDQNDPNIDPFRVKLFPAAEPLSQVAFRLANHTFSSLRPIHHDGRGMAGVKEAFIYPVPGPLDKWEDAADARWQGVAIYVHEKPEQRAYDVEFHLRQPQNAIWPGGQARRIPRPAKVEVRQDSSGLNDYQVTGYEAPEQPLPHITQADYERKAKQEIMRMPLGL